MKIESRKRRQLADDTAAAANTTARVTKLAQASGLASRLASKHSTHALPANLEPSLAVAERRLMHQAMEYFEAIHRIGIPVFHLTWCLPRFRAPAGGLAPSMVQAVRALAGRRARNLKAYGLRMIGAVDLSFDRDLDVPGGEWCVHIHVLIAMPDAPRKLAGKLIKKAFRDAPCPNRSNRDPKPIKAPQIGTEAYLLTAMSYASGPLALVDHNTRQNRHRRLRLKTAASGYTSDQHLPAELQTEFTRLYAAIGPRGLWVLSGFRRRGNRIVPESPFSVQEEAALRQLRKHRKTVRKALKRDAGGFLKVNEELRIFD